MQLHASSLNLLHFACMLRFEIQYISTGDRKKMYNQKKISSVSYYDQRQNQTYL